MLLPMSRDKGTTGRPVCPGTSCGMSRFLEMLVGMWQIKEHHLCMELGCVLAKDNLGCGKREFDPSLKFSLSTRVGQEGFSVLFLCIYNKNLEKA